MLTTMETASGDGNTRPAPPAAWLEPEEVTRAVLYLVDDGAEHITGTVMDVSAGASARFTA